MEVKLPFSTLLLAARNEVAMLCFLSRPEMPVWTAPETQGKIITVLSWWQGHCLALLTSHTACSSSGSGLRMWLGTEAGLGSVLC